MPAHGNSRLLTVVVAAKLSAAESRGQQPLKHLHFYRNEKALLDSTTAKANDFLTQTLKTERPRRTSLSSLLENRSPHGAHTHGGRCQLNKGHGWEHRSTGPGESWHKHITIVRRRGSALRRTHAPPSPARLPVAARHRLRPHHRQLSVRRFLTGAVPRKH